MLLIYIKKVTLIINKTVIMNKTDYNNKIQNLLSDNSTYIKLEKDPTNDINLKLKSILLSWKSKKVFNDNLFKYIHSATKFYGLPKLHISLTVH